jgi:hypothetical protein
MLGNCRLSPPWSHIKHPATPANGGGRRYLRADRSDDGLAIEVSTIERPLLERKARLFAFCSVIDLKMNPIEVHDPLRSSLDLLEDEENQITKSEAENSLLGV